MVLLRRLLLITLLALASSPRAVVAIMPTELVPGEPPIHLSNMRRHDTKTSTHKGGHAPSPTIPVHPLPDREVAPVVKTADGKADKFTPVEPNAPIVQELIERFMLIYEEEMKRTALNATVLHVLKAEKTPVRDETQEEELDANGIGVEFVQEAETQQYRLYLLLQYRFLSSMLDAKRPYVSVMRLTMDCYNASSLTELDTEADANGDVDGELTDLPDAAPHLECDVLQHVDLPRRNDSRHDIPAYIQRQIFHSAPKSFVHNHTLNVYYDALEAQDLAVDAHNHPVRDRDTMHYVRFRVQGGNAQDCMIVIEHARGVNTLRYQDSICYDNTAVAAGAAAAASVSVFRLTKANLPAFVLLASLVGASVALFVVWRQRRRQRSGYSYVHSGSSKHVPTTTSPTSAVNSAAVAC
ncbi:hypothetical protein P43SY_006219 [Pythium insidiosum]|uniref:Transmembrane protein n=1 Tax=Pythium insidiosum TaxID=114742 RepID=A0AAD5Q6B8_PYTIN|nr:hypothetical protein P43SY_006219 [Pythium insidiosum]